MTHKIKGSIQLTPQSAEPGSPVSGQIFYDSDDSFLKVYDGSGFRRVINLDSAAKIPAVDGSLITSVNAAQLGGKTVGTGANNIVALDGSSKLPAVDGSLLTNLPGAQSSDVAILYQSNTISTLSSIRAGSTVQTDYPAFSNGVLGDDGDCDYQWHTGPGSLFTGNGVIFHNNNLTASKKYAFIVSTKVDDFADNSLDTNIWTNVSGFTETNRRLEMSGINGNARCSGVNAPNYKRASGDYEIYLWGAVSGNNSGGPTIQLTDGTTSINLQTSGDQSNNWAFWRFIIHQAAKTADVYYNGTLQTSAINLATLTAYYLQFNNGAGWGGQSTYTFFCHVAYLDLAAGVQAKTFTVQRTLATSKSRIYFYADEDKTYGNITYEISLNGGTNYEAITNNSFLTLANAGTGLRLRITMTTDSSARTPNIYSWGIQVIS